MKTITEEVLEEFDSSSCLRGYERPKLLGEMEREPAQDDVFDISDAHCPVDRFLLKNRGWR